MCNILRANVSTSKVRGVSVSIVEKRVLHVCRFWHCSGVHCVWVVQHDCAILWYRVLAMQCSLLLHCSAQIWLLDHVQRILSSAFVCLFVCSFALAAGAGGGGGGGGGNLCEAKQCSVVITHCSA